jgi:hypothetical protein
MIKTGEIYKSEVKVMRRGFLVFFFVLLWCSVAIADGNDSGRITGAWVPRNIGPITNGLIYLFNANLGPPPKTDRFFRRIPDAVGKTTEDGKFIIELANGSYYLSVQKKVGGDLPGPPQDGDLSGVIRDKRGNPIIYKIKSGKITDIGMIRQATVYKTPFIKLTKGMTAITGVVKADDGLPLADAVVLVYDNPTINGKPNFISHKTGRDGKYIVQVDHEGTYYVTIRAVNGGGRPQPGDMVGSYGGETAKPVTVKMLNVTKGVDIQVRHFADKRPA